MLTVLGVVLAATATGAAGPIGFVAPTAPQLARRLTRTPQLPLLNAASTGAIVLVAADLAARTRLPPLEIPVGALTALVGGPYPLWLLGRRTGTRRGPRSSAAPGPGHPAWIRSSPCRSRTGTAHRC
ncbi:iron chelate uptake ABC transporter family permease subunit [Streptomyces cyaneochromogenes]|uniref:iron chelate uptake ABC transporter family permease subunit n=1 Tax=Streptomyces cyaneochromogenes TaxID=2496836 RepID=UPI003899F90F